ncbi:hypothetical protein GGF32_009114 [Allomyces javanicus]|nr:hypothetical protein GGF32_009114 [Allomyces javanicus]
MFRAHSLSAKAALRLAANPFRASRALATKIQPPPMSFTPGPAPVGLIPQQELETFAQYPAETIIHTVWDGKVTKMSINQGQWTTIDHSTSVNMRKARTHYSDGTFTDHVEFDVKPLPKPRKGTGPF